MVLDPHLARHLAHFGIDIIKMEKVNIDCLNVAYYNTHPPNMYSQRWHEGALYARWVSGV